MIILTGTFQQMTQVTQSLIIMQEAIIILCKTEDNPNRKERLNRVADQVIQSKKNLERQLTEYERVKRK